MNKFIIIVVFSFFSCHKYNVDIEKGFTKIDRNFQDRNKLIDKIEPNEKYQYWEFVFSNPGLQSGKDKVLRNVGDSLIKSRYKIINPKKGFFNECMPSWCYSYIAYVKNGKVNYVTDEQGLKNFIGNINSLEEAILIAKLNDLWFDSEEIKAGAYKKTKNGYELYLMKYYNCPVKMESIKANIDTTGKFSSKSNGIYFESTDCIVS
ncbi:hypothetical protein [Flavobacterium sp. 245]|uniref:hypothetical protein n=1 Tax=Flavobacterium sp. 245 TaxID=2512115 RepID=UPI00106027E1|nr:hypothetical protein [Flavobacterium sp. 245]TDP01686.1 hypothetical protein EV145_104396 [Flavobacterium sp. 245]